MGCYVMIDFRSLDGQLSGIDRTISDNEEFLASAFGASITQSHRRDLKSAIKDLKQATGKFKDFKSMLGRMIARMDEPTRDANGHSPERRENGVLIHKLDFKGTTTEVVETVRGADEFLIQTHYQLWRLEKMLMDVVRDKAMGRTPLCVLENEPPLWQALQQTKHTGSFCAFLTQLIRTWHLFGVLNHVPVKPTWDENE